MRLSKLITLALASVCLVVSPGAGQYRYPWQRYYYAPPPYLPAPYAPLPAPWIANPYLTDPYAPVPVRPVVRIAIHDDRFEPRTIAVPLGAKVRFTNHSETSHAVVARDGAFASRELPPGASYSVTFHRPGIYYYRTRQQDRMDGAIIVGFGNEFLSSQTRKLAPNLDRDEIRDSYPNREDYPNRNLSPSRDR